MQATSLRHTSNQSSSTVSFTMFECYTLSNIISLLIHPVAFVHQYYATC